MNLDNIIFSEHVGNIERDLQLESNLKEIKPAQCEKKLEILIL